MSNDYILKVEGLSKKYLLNDNDLSQNDMLVKDVLSKLKQFKAFKGSKKQSEFLALNDISFEIKKGDRVGVIGRNGAGKSTLLKILSRITPPSKGKIEYYGKMASLLEVGTGFHPDLTGRENIFLNGSILGMSKKDIEKKFDEIVDFSEVGQFIDTPVKRYSSGMYVRLAFSVAAHLESDILIVDEVLAVGDSGFQRKCIDKMASITKSGKTLFFVSHNLSSVSALCNRALLLNKGQLILDADVNKTIDEYNNLFLLKGKKINLIDKQRANYANELLFEWIEFENDPVPYKKNIKFRCKLKSIVKKEFRDIDFGFNISDKNHSCLMHLSNRFIHQHYIHNDDNDIYEVEVEHNLKPGYYMLFLFLGTGNTIQDFMHSQIGFEIGEGNPYNFADIDQIQGNILPNFSIRKTI